MTNSEIVLKIDGIDLLELYGHHDSKLNMVRRAFPQVAINYRGERLTLKGEKKHAQRAKAKMEALLKALRRHNKLTKYDIQDILNNGAPQTISTPKGTEVILFGKDGRPISARTQNQRRLKDSVAENDVIFAVGPAGTGKTYTAVALAVRALKERQVKKIILTRPAVEAGESLGFLPGDLKEKVDPYLTPLYDALNDMIPPEKLKHFMEQRTIEVAPLAFMRGRTLDEAFVILDEAQNATVMQIKMFLTRLGPKAKYVITGDLTQVDLPFKQRSGLRKAMDILSGIPGIDVIRMNADDVVRHRLVKDIIRVFGEDAERERIKRQEEE